MKISNPSTTILPCPIGQCDYEGKKGHLKRHLMQMHGYSSDVADQAITKIIEIAMEVDQPESKPEPEPESKPIEETEEIEPLTIEKADAEYDRELDTDIALLRKELRIARYQARINDLRTKTIVQNQPFSVDKLLSTIVTALQNRQDAATDVQIAEIENQPQGPDLVQNLIQAFMQNPKGIVDTIAAYLPQIKGFVESVKKSSQIR